MRQGWATAASSKHHGRHALIQENPKPCSPHPLLQVGAPGLGKSCFIRNLVGGMRGAAAHAEGDEAPAPTPLSAFRVLPDALCTRFDVASQADANAVFHFSVQARMAL